jgi:hypothetical protein
MTSNTISIGLECVLGKHGIHESNQTIYHLLIKRLIVPHTLALVIHFVPPTQSNQYPPTYILHCPKVKCDEEHCNNKLDDKALDEDRAQNVKCKGGKLQANQPLHHQ